MVLPALAGILVSLFTSLTVRVAFVFAGIGVGAVLFDTAMGYALDYKVRYIPELFALLSAMFTGLAVKNGADNFISYKRDTSTVIQGLGAPPR